MGVYMVKIFMTFGGYGLYNIALEEYLLDKSLEIGDILMRIWVQDRTVVVGVSTPIMLEVDISEARRRGIPVIRRQSGGGAVYHDMGNINFSIYIPRRIMDISWIYRYGHKYLLRVLERLGLNGYIENRNDIVVEGYKVSGSSIWIRRDSTLYHATLLVEADIQTLKKVVKPRLDLIEKGVYKPSKYNPENLSRFVDIDVRGVIDEILSVIDEIDGGYQVYRLDNLDYKRLVEITRSKYMDSRWHIQGSFRDEPPLNLLL